MAEITHVVLKAELVRDDPHSVTVYAEAGFPDSDDVCTSVEYGPVDIVMHGQSGVRIRAEDMTAVLESLLEGIRDECGVELSMVRLRELAEFVGFEEPEPEVD